MQSAQNALDFGKDLVTKWLVAYKFKNWTVNSSSGETVTDDEKRARAKEVADKLCDHQHWLSHGRSIRIPDLEEMKLQITDYSKNPLLSDAIARYYALVQMIFFTNIYKVYETVGSQIMKGLAPRATAAAAASASPAGGGGHAWLSDIWLAVP